MIYPMVSLIMPTRGRPNLAAIALQCAIRQDYDSSRMEIVIFDDEDSPSFSDPPTTPVHHHHDPTAPIPRDQPLLFPPIRYFRNPQSLFPSLGAKRNAMCEEARGELIAHIDSDDLSSPNRLSIQVRELLYHGCDIAGFHTVPFYDISTGDAYVYHLNSACVCGTSLVYRREFWRLHPFPSVDVGEDLPFTSGNREHRVSSDGSQLLVALLHDDNMSSRRQARNHPACFPQIPVDKLPEWFRARAMENKWWPTAFCGNLVPEISNGSMLSTK